MKFDIEGKELLLRWYSEDKFGRGRKLQYRIKINSNVHWNPESKKYVEEVAWGEWTDIPEIFKEEKKQ